MLLPPINFIFKLLQQHSTVQIWLYEQLGIRIEGKIRVCPAIRSSSRGSAVSSANGASQGFDEFMNLVIDDAVEVRQITKTNDKETRRSLGIFSRGLVAAAVHRAYFFHRPNSSQRRQCVSNPELVKLRSRGDGQYITKFAEPVASAHSKRHLSSRIIPRSLSGRSWGIEDGGKSVNLILGDIFDVAISQDQSRKRLIIGADGDFAGRRGQELLG